MEITKDALDKEIQAAINAVIEAKGVLKTLVALRQYLDKVEEVPNGPAADTTPAA